MSDMANNIDDSKYVDIKNGIVIAKIEDKKIYDALDSYMAGVNPIVDDKTREDMLRAIYTGGLLDKNDDVPLRLFIDSDYHIPNLEKRLFEDPLNYMKFIRMLSTIVSYVMVCGDFDDDSIMVSSFQITNDTVIDTKTISIESLEILKKLDGKLSDSANGKYSLTNEDKVFINKARKTAAWILDLLGFRRNDDPNLLFEKKSDISGKTRFNYYASLTDDIPVFIEPKRPEDPNEDSLFDGSDGLSSFAFDDWDFSILSSKIEYYKSDNVISIVLDALNVLKSNGYIDPGDVDLNVSDLKTSIYGSFNAGRWNYRNVAPIGLFALGSKIGPRYMNVYNDLIKWNKDNSVDLDWSIVNLEWIWDNTKNYNVDMFLEDVKSGDYGLLL